MNMGEVRDKYSLKHNDEPDVEKRREVYRHSVCLT
jgi:hypothetical protein